jgi:hypothetical protein
VAALVEGGHEGPPLRRCQASEEIPPAEIRVRAGLRARPDQGRPQGAAQPTMLDVTENPLPRELPEGYYLDNFERLLATVAERYGDLLLAGENAFLSDFARLSLPARRLYVRLLSRRGPLVRQDRLFYREIPDLAAAGVELAAAGFADDGAELPQSEHLSLLLREELIAMAGELGRPLPRSIKRPEAQAALELAEDPGLLPLLLARWPALRPLRLEVVQLFRLLFFGNLFQDLKDFVLNDIGIVEFESYDLSRELRLFESRHAIDSELQLRLLRGAAGQHLWQGEFEPALAIAKAVVAAWDVWHEKSRRQAEALLVSVAQAAERLGQPELALGLYKRATRPPARERTARLLAGAGEYQEALRLCREIEAEPRDETEANFAPFFREKLEKLLDPSRKRPRRPSPATLEMAVDRDVVSVEQQALAALAGLGRRGVYAENWLWKSLFGLAFWDIVYAPVPGAFHHPFQYGPHDLDSPTFRQARAQAIDKRLAELEAAADLRPSLFEVFERKAGKANALVSWHPGSRASLELALELIRGPHLAKVSDRLSRDLGRYRRGLPDLLVESQNAPGFELWEVKGPGDQLRPEQKSWLDYLNANGLPAGVLKLRWR